MAKLTLRGLTRRFEGASRPALDGLDLEVADGELLVLVGPSGCGKSTALRLIAGLDHPSSGQVLLADRDMSEDAPQDRDVAMVFQGYALYPHMVVRDIMAFPLKMRSVAAEERKRLVEETAEMLGLTRLLDRHPGELSGGERQRVAMGRAIVRSPKVFLFDEPLSNLDAALRTELRVELAALLRRLGTTAVYVTHDQVEAMTLGDRIAIMRDGELQQVGSPREVYESPANVFVAGFLGSPAMNLLELRREKDTLEAGSLRMPRPAGLKLPKNVTAGIRPEELVVCGDGASDDGTVRFDVTVEATESLGADTYAYFDADGTRLRARAPGFYTPSAGEPAQLGVDLSSILWFDTKSGKLIGRGSEKLAT